MASDRSIEGEYKKNRGAFLSRAGRKAYDASEGEDALHDVFLRLLANAYPIEAIANLTAWISRAVRNRIIDLWRRDSYGRDSLQSRIAGETISQILAGTGLDPADQLFRKELSEDLSRAIGALPEEQRMIIEAQALDGLTFRQISEKTGISINTLMTRKRLAVRKLTMAMKYWMDD